ncbi:MAG: hypothetical protein ACYDFT_01900 [Thermoplasmata archaeon]
MELTVLMAGTEIGIVVLVAALALVLLGYRGEEAVRRIRLGPVGPTDPEPPARGPPTRAQDPVSPGTSGSSRPAPYPVVDGLRVGLGLIWLVNLLFIILPSANYWSSFATVAQSYGPSSFGGPGLAGFVASHAPWFAALLAVVTAYLAVALILGVSTRFALVVGTVTSAILLVTQFGTTFVVPGGTDVGAQPLYLLMYAALWYGGAGQLYAVDAWLWFQGWGARVPMARWFASPAPPGALGAEATA